ncbi:hypothetical protein I317_03363 [Kwoniella heveanensis CBS 569]|nr:hypothetical protein I317_03363 [Kwoniella heveanensis CBS 569]
MYADNPALALWGGAEGYEWTTTEEEHPLEQQPGTSFSSSSSQRATSSGRVALYSTRGSSQHKLGSSADLRRATLLARAQETAERTSDYSFLEQSPSTFASKGSKHQRKHLHKADGSIVKGTSTHTYSQKQSRLGGGVRGRSAMERLGEQ